MRTRQDQRIAERREERTLELERCLLAALQVLNDSRCEVPGNTLALRERCRAALPASAVVAGSRTVASGYGAIHHINGDDTDNSPGNLRIVDERQP
jgi:hypothetical protein